MSSPNLPHTFLLLLPLTIACVGEVGELDSFDDGVFDDSISEEEDRVPEGETTSLGADEYHCGALQNDALEFCHRFEEQDHRMGEKYKDRKDQLFWSESRILRSYVEMYYATGELHWADKLIVHIDSVLALQDVSNGDQDSGGNSAYGWSATHNGDGPYRYPVHSGMVSYPIAQFVEIVRDRNLDAPYQAKADAYLNAVERTVAAHNPRFRVVSSDYVTVRSDEGYYFWSCNDAVAASSQCWNNPHNQQLAMGSTLLVLHKLTGKAEYRDKARRMGRVFWRDLTELGAGYNWGYWWGDSKAKCGGCDKAEDTGHASIDIEFITQAYRQGFNIGNSNNPFPTDADMLRFSRTFTDNIYVSPTNLLDRVDGATSSSDMGKPRGAGQWVDLSDFDANVYEFAKATYQSSANDFPRSNDRIVLLGWAKLTRAAARLGR